MGLSKRSSRKKGKSKHKEHKLPPALPDELAEARAEAIGVVKPPEVGDFVGVDGSPPIGVVKSVEPSGSIDVELETGGTVSMDNVYVGGGAPPQPGDRITITTTDGSNNYVHVGPLPESVEVSTNFDSAKRRSEEEEKHLRELKGATESVDSSLEDLEAVMERLLPKASDEHKEFAGAALESLKQDLEKIKRIIEERS